jgi:hypothetical protein
MSTLLDCRNIIAVSAVALLAGCGMSGDGPAGLARTEGMATLTVQLTDAPFPIGEVDRADIFVVRVDGMMAESDEQAAQSGAMPAPSHPTPILRRAG